MGDERILFFFSVGFGVGVEYVQGGKKRYFFSDSESMSDSKVFRHRSLTRELESKVFRSWSLSSFFFHFRSRSRISSRVIVGNKSRSRLGSIVGVGFRIRSRIEKK